MMDAPHAKDRRTHTHTHTHTHPPTPSLGAPALPAVSLAEWAETVPAYAVCTFELRRGTTQWYVQPTSWRPLREASQPAAPAPPAPPAPPGQRYFVIKDDVASPLIEVAGVQHLGAVAQLLTGGAEGAPARVWGSIGGHAWRPLATELIAAAVQATSEGRAVGAVAGVVAPLPRDLPRLAVVLQLATLPAGSDAEVLARLQRGETVCIASVPQRMMRDNT